MKRVEFYLRHEGSRGVRSFTVMENNRRKCPEPRDRGLLVSLVGREFVVGVRCKKLEREELQRALNAKQDFVSDYGANRKPQELI